MSLLTDAALSVILVTLSTNIPYSPRSNLGLGHYAVEFYR